MSAGTFATGPCVLGAASGNSGAVLLDGGTFAPDVLAAGSGDGSILLAGGTLRVAGQAVVEGDLQGISVQMLAGTTSTLDATGKDVRVFQDVEQALDAANLTHRWSFNKGSLEDSITHENATTSGTVSLTDDNARAHLKGGVVQLGSAFDECTDAFTVEMWFILVNPGNWHRMFYACDDDVTEELKLLPARGSFLDSWRLWLTSPTKTGNGVQVEDKVGFSCWKEYHISLVGRRTSSCWEITMHKRDGYTGRLIDKGTLVAPTDWNLSDLKNVALGNSLTGSTSGYECYFNEVRVWKTAMSDLELSKSARLGPDATFSDGDAGLVKTGTGALALEGKTSYTGSTTVSAGTLVAGETLRPSHRWSFHDSTKVVGERALDSEGGLAVVKSGSSNWKITYDDDGIVLPGYAHGGAYLALGKGPAVFNGCENGFTVEMWATCLDRTGLSWPRIVSIFSNGQSADVISMGWTHGSDATRDIICAYYGGVNNVYADKLAPYETDTEYHIAFSVYPGETDGEWKASFYKQSATGETLKKFDVTLPTGWTPDCLASSTAYLGFSPASEQSDAHARYSECRIWPCALTESELSRLGAQGKETVAFLRASPASDTSAASNLKHRWSFNGSLEDSVGGQTAVVTGDKIKLGTTTLTLGGSEDNYVELGSAFDDCTEEFTLETWYCQTALNGWSWPFILRNSDSTYAFWYYTSRGGYDDASKIPQINIKSPLGSVVDGNSNGFYCRTSQLYHFVVTGVKYPTGWQVVVGVRDVTTGEILSNVAMTPKSDWDLAQMTSFYLGKSKNVGYFDEIRVWNRVLSNSELTRNALAGPDAIPSFERGLPAGKPVTVASGATLCGNGIAASSLSGAGSFLGSYVLGTGSILDMSEAMPESFGDLSFTGGATIKVAQSLLAAGSGVPVGGLSVSGANTVTVVSGGENLRWCESLFVYDEAEIDSAATWTVTGGRHNTSVCHKPSYRLLMLRSPMGTSLFFR